MTAFSPLTFIRHFLSALYPPRCLCCGVLTAGDAALCGSCLAIWQAERVNASSPERTDGVKYLAVYTKNRSVARTLVLTAKRSNERRLYNFLALELAETLSGQLKSADYIVNVPRSPASVRKTGVDQAELLAKALSAVTGVQYLAALRHRRFTATQKTLDAAGRFANAANAYYPDRKNAIKLNGKTVILLDDVATTGSTLSACETLLREAGALRVIKAAAASAQ